MWTYVASRDSKLSQDISKFKHLRGLAHHLLLLSTYSDEASSTKKLLYFKQPHVILRLVFLQAEESIRSCLVGALGLSPHGLLRAWDWPVEGKGPGIFPCSYHPLPLFYAHATMCLHLCLSCASCSRNALFHRLHSGDFHYSPFPSAPRFTILCELSPSSCIF